LLDLIGRQLLFTLDPETAHGLSIRALKCGLPLSLGAPRDKRLNVRVAGLDFPNPLGMAAGYDKNAEAPDALLGLGFGFAEVGTVTPVAQSGNPKPRIFRLVQDEAVINRLGFNNEGHDAAEKRLQARAGKAGVVGVNIGANKDSTDRIGDYELGVARFAALATYLTVNISSPNTPGLRTMQARESLAELLARVMAARAKASRQPPVFLKIAPDLVEAEIEDIAAAAGKKIDGVIVSNTTITRQGLASQIHARETGGLSGNRSSRNRPPFWRGRESCSGRMLRSSVSAVSTRPTPRWKNRAGADLVQLYTGMIYAGPSLPGRIVRGMLKALETEGVKSLRALRDGRLEHWAAQPI
jgi:dihydroorotate dehydrogenase